MDRRFLGTGEHMQAAQDHPSASTAVPVSQGVSTFREREMDGDAYELREGLPARRPLKQVLVTVGDLPLGRSCTGDAGQRQRRSQHMFAEAGVRILGIERIEQESVAQ